MSQFDVSPYVSVELLCGNSRKKPVLNANLVMALREIDKCGSINKAVKRLHMGYSHTLYLIADIEEALDCAIVERSRPGGSRLTNEGRRLVSLFEEVQENTQTYALTLAQGANASAACQTGE